jgi:hypothetical protein
LHISPEYIVFIFAEPVNLYKHITNDNKSTDTTEMRNKSNQT